MGLIGFQTKENIGIEDLVKENDIIFKLNILAYDENEF